jgi:hypothetical protein
MRDVDITPVLQDPQFVEDADEFWVGPLQEASIDVFAERRSAIWKNAGRPGLENRFVSSSADAFFAELAAQTAERAASG